MHDHDRDEKHNGSEAMDLCSPAIKALCCTGRMCKYCPMENTPANPNKRSLVVLIVLLIAVAVILFLVARNGSQTTEMAVKRPIAAFPPAAMSTGAAQGTSPMSIMQAAIAAGDPAQCEGLPVEQMKIFCQISAGMKDGDTTICTKISSSKQFPFKSPMTGYNGSLNATDFCWMRAIRRNREDLCHKVSAEFKDQCKKELEALPKRGVMPPGMRGKGTPGMPPGMGGLPPVPPDGLKQSRMPPPPPAAPSPR